MRVEKAKVYQCPVCGEVFGEIVITGKEPIYFARGPKKGQLKELVDVTTTIEFPGAHYEYKPEVVRVYAIDVESKYEDGILWESKELTGTRDLYICPNCKAVFSEVKQVKLTTHTK